MIHRSLAVMALGIALLVAGCQQPADPDGRAAANPEKYARDRSLCQGQVDEYMHSRRRIDDASAGTFANDSDRSGRDGLSNQMANYSDSRNADKFMASCMDARGWPQPQKSWWQKIGG
jgi:hypothetical protein